MIDKEQRLQRLIRKPVTVIKIDPINEEDGVKYRFKGILHCWRHGEDATIKFYECRPSTSGPRTSFKLEEVEEIKGKVITLNTPMFR